MSLKTRITQHIKAQGPLTVAEYMERAVSHYYATRDPFGKDGDFTTAPEISQIFGELIGAWIAQAWGQLGFPNTILCELGGGRGTLMDDALRATKHVKKFHDALTVHMVETSPFLKKRQQELLQGKHPHIHWHETIETLPPLPLLAVANEFFDALPIRQHMRVEGKWQDRKVDYISGELVWAPAGDIVSESSAASTNIMAQLATHIKKHGGALLVIDYGYTQGSRGDTLQALKQHEPCDPLAEPGEADITAHVDFEALKHTAKGRGAQVWGAIEQGTFLKRLGAELRATALCKNTDIEQQKRILSGLERLVAPHQMGEHFKVLAVTSFKEKPAGF